MNKALKRVEKIDNALIKEIIERIVKAINPEKIILFGSYIYGNPAKWSDLDILVITKSDSPRYKRAIPVYDALAGILISKDIVVYTPEEVKEWETVPNAFITSVIRKGRVMYEKQT